MPSSDSILKDNLVLNQRDDSIQVPMLSNKQTNKQSCHFNL